MGISPPAKGAGYPFIVFRPFLAGLNALTRLTEGRVHLCVGPDAPEALRATGQATVHTFSGPHPAGNSSTHIHFVDPIAPGDTVWTCLLYTSDAADD